MRALILDRGDAAVELSIEDDRLLADRAGDELIGGEVVVPHRDVPRVAQVLHEPSVRANDAGH